MTSLRLAICDDDGAERQRLLAWVEQWAATRHLAVQSACYSSAEAFLFAQEGGQAFDILLLDIEMAQMSGIALARHIRKTDRRAQILFITSHFEFIGEGYEVDALNYLVKPVKPEKLYEVLSRAVQRLSMERRTVIVKCENETVRLYEDEILYAEAFLHDISIHTAAREYRVRESISAFAGRLGDGFFRVHRSYLTALAHVVRISRGEVELDNGAVLPLSRGQYDALNRAFIDQG